MIQLYNVDCREAMAGMAENSVDSVVTDPPYGLKFMGKAWDHGIPGVEFWQATLRVMKPGAYMLAFGGTRTFHRLVCAIEDAGFEIRDTIMWVYGSGFPKSLDVAKAIDKESGVEFDAVPASGVGFMNAEGAGGYNITKNQLVRRGESTDAAKQWQGWGTALKPSFEPIILVRKPLIWTVAQNVLQWGTGGLNIDGCRVGNIVETWPASRSYAPGQMQPGHSGSTQSTGAAPPGRWPANLIHDGSDEVLAAFPQAPGQQADVSTTAPSEKMSNVYGKMSYGRGDEPSANSDNEGAVGFKMKPGARRLDEGSAARFFYCAKASRKDRGEGNGHPTVKPTDLMRYLCRLVTPPGGVVLDPFMGSGSTGKAAMLEGFDFIGCDNDPESFATAERRIGAAELERLFS